MRFKIITAFLVPFFVTSLPNQGQANELSILGIEVGQRAPSSCRATQETFARNFGLEEFKVYTCTINVDGESIRLLLNGVDSPEEIIEVKRRQIFNNFDGYSTAEAAISFYGERGRDYSERKLFHFTTHTWQSSSGYPAQLEVTVGNCADPNLNFRCTGLTYVEYVARAQNIGEIFDGLVEASKTAPKF